jgi:hypothetical protein
MAMGHALVHTAVPRVSSEEGEWVEGERDVGPKDGTPFPVLLQLPTGGSEETVPRGRRSIQQPQILYEPFDVEGGEVTLTAADELKVTAEDLKGALGGATTVWQVDGDPTPLAKPGQLVGYLARLKRVKD